MRPFTHSPAKRARALLAIAIVGPSGSGKTFSSLRLARGIQRVVGGKTFLIDTEDGRSLHYAADDDRGFQFEHMPFDPPFDSLSYLSAMETCVKAGATTIIVDSMTHEHDGDGGVLAQYQKHMTGKGGGYSMIAWGKAKEGRKILLRQMTRLRVNLILCWRSKEKLDIQEGKDPEKMGFQPIGDKDFVYEMTCRALLLPNANGVPDWQPERRGEEALIKLPEQFRKIVGTGKPFSEEMGEQMAVWSLGDINEESVLGKTLATIAACTDIAKTSEGLKGGTWTDDERQRIRWALTVRSRELKAKP